MVVAGGVGAAMGGPAWAVGAAGRAARGVQGPQERRGPPRATQSTYARGKALWGAFSWRFGAVRMHVATGKG